MIEYTRISVIGSERRAEVALPSSEPVGNALPELIKILGEASKPLARPLVLLTPIGEQVDLTASPQEQELLEGAVLRLTRSDEAAAPPVVIDLTEATADAHDAHAKKWDARARHTIGALAVALGGAIAGQIAPLDEPRTHLTALIVALSLALSGSVVSRWKNWVGPEILTTALAVGLALPTALATNEVIAAHNSSAAENGTLLTAVLFTAMLGIIALIVAGMIRRQSAVIVGGALATGLSGLFLTLVLTDVAVPPAAGIVATLGVFALGILPWVAIGSAGLTGLDDAASQGSHVRRAEAQNVVHQAYRALTWGIAASAAAVVTGGLVLVFETDIWSLWLLVALTLASALRTRTFPLRAHGYILWSLVAALTIGGAVRILSDESAWSLPLGIIALTAFAALLALLNLPDHVRARLRRWGDTLETIAVISLVPLIVGSFGIYGQLLSTFGGK